MNEAVWLDCFFEFVEFWLGDDFVDWVNVWIHHLGLLRVLSVVFLLRLQSVAFYPLHVLLCGTIIGRTRQHVMWVYACYLSSINWQSRIGCNLLIEMNTVVGFGCFLVSCLSRVQFSFYDLQFRQYEFTAAFDGLNFVLLLTDCDCEVLFCNLLVTLHVQFCWHH